MSRFSVAVGAVVIGAVALGMIFHAAGWRINTTKSIPLGLYQLTNKPVSVGEYVLFCPPDSAEFRRAREYGYIGIGHCPGGLGQLMKKVLAAKGDTVSVSGSGVSVNGERLANSVPLGSDPAGRPLPTWRPTELLVPPGSFLLMSDVNAISYDARYFGLISSQQILGVIRPIINW